MGRVPRSLCFHLRPDGRDDLGAFGFVGATMAHQVLDLGVEQVHRQCAAAAGMNVGHLTSEERADVFDELSGIEGGYGATGRREAQSVRGGGEHDVAPEFHGHHPGDRQQALEDAAQVADGDALADEPSQHPIDDIDPVAVDGQAYGVRREPA